MTLAVEVLIGAMLLGSTGFLLLCALRLLVSYVRQWRARREIRKMLAGDRDRLVQHVARMRQRVR